MPLVRTVRTGWIALFRAQRACGIMGLTTGTAELNQSAMRTPAPELGA